MDPKSKGDPRMRIGGFVGDTSMNQDFDQDEVPDKAKKAGADVNDGVGLIDKLPGSEM